MLLNGDGLWKLGRERLLLCEVASRNDLYFPGCKRGARWHDGNGLIVQQFPLISAGTASLIICSAQAKLVLAFKGENHDSPP